MIENSTPWSITYRGSGNQKIIFYGEWTAEPKFYLHSNDLAKILLPDGTKLNVSLREKKAVLPALLNDAKARGWNIVLEGSW